MIIIEKRFAHPHKNNVSHAIVCPVFFFSEPLLDIAISKEHLRNHLFPGQILPEP